MKRTVVLIGTDTDAGKTTFAKQFLAQHHDTFAYWKPVETGDSDTLAVRRAVPAATAFEPLARFQTPVAPLLAAQVEGGTMPSIDEVIAAMPVCDHSLLIETFGGPFSPFDANQLQLELLRKLKADVWLATLSTVGAIGRTLQTLTALRHEQIHPTRVILVGPTDSFAERLIRQYWPNITVSSVPFPQPTVADENWLARDRAATWHPYTSLHDPIDPVTVVGADREFLRLASGRTLIDAVSSWWTILHGHCHPPLVQALRSAAATLDHVLFAGATHPHAIQLAEHLLASVAWPAGGRVFYSDNGSTAVEVALKMAYQFWCHHGEPQRTLFVGFDDCYHGDTFGAMAVSRDPVFFGRFEPLLFSTTRVPVSANRLDEVLAKQASSVAAVILEPLIQAAGGMKFHSVEELAAIAAVCRRHQVLLIVDEVMTMHRTGGIWAYTQANIVPDLIATAKTLTGGMMPLAATLASPAIVEAFATADRTRTFFHGHSYTANPLACAVAVANAKLVREPQFVANASRIESFWRTHLADVPGSRVCGTVGVVELADAGGYLAARGPAIRQIALESGVLLRPLGNVLYAMPPLLTSDESLARIVEVMNRVASAERT